MKKIIRFSFFVGIGLMFSLMHGCGDDTAAGNATVTISGAGS